MEGLLRAMLEELRKPPAKPTPEEMEELYQPMLERAGQMAKQMYREQEDLHMLRYHAKMGKPI